MKSIAQTAHGGQWLKGRIYPNGLHIDSPLKGVKIVGTRRSILASQKRGKITGFSVASRRRMREALLSLEVPQAQILGVTFTVPWKGTDFSPLMDEFRNCWHRFCVAFRRSFPNSGMIYRVELQERGAPHIHAIWWLADSDARTDGQGESPGRPCAGAYSIKSIELKWLWMDAVPNLHRGSYTAFDKYGVKVEQIANAGAMYRYLADHASKHKQAQLGYNGKQWGIVLECNFKRRVSVRLPDFESERHEVLFVRLLRKVKRYRLTSSRHPNWKRKPPFGSVLRGSRCVVGDSYMTEETVMRMFEHARQLARSDL